MRRFEVLDTKIPIRSDFLTPFVVVDLENNWT